MSYTVPTTSLRPKARPLTESLRPKLRPSERGLAAREEPEQPQQETEETGFWDYFDLFGGSTPEDDNTPSSERASRLYEQDEMSVALDNRPGIRESPFEYFPGPNEPSKPELFIAVPSPVTTPAETTAVDGVPVMSEEPIVESDSVSTEGLMSRPDTSDLDATTMSFVESNEGRKNTPYKDTKGLWTVGVGHFLGTKLPDAYKNEDGTPRTLSDAEVQTMFEEDYAKHKKEAATLPMYDQLDDKGKQALIDLTFNMGASRFNEKEWPKFFAALKSRDLATAAAELKDSKWYGEVKSRAPKVIELISGASFN